METRILAIDETTWCMEDGDIVRCFLLAGTERALLIDSGMTLDARAAAEGLTSLPLSLLNTHADPDHTGSNSRFETFYMHPAEASNYYNTRGGTGEFTPVYEGTVIDLGERPLEILLLPGHTPGSIAVLDIRRRMLFSGDTVQENSRIYMYGVQREMHAYRCSLKRLLAEKPRFDRIFPCHGTCPLPPESVDRLYEITGHLQEYPVQETDNQGSRVLLCDAGIVKFLLDR